MADFLDCSRVVRALGAATLAAAALTLGGCGVVFHVADRVDADGDGFYALSNPEDYLGLSVTELEELRLDCDDEDDDRWPGAAELCDGLDNDCDGVVSDAELDLDGDGFTACGIREGTTDFLGEEGRDCNDDPEDPIAPYQFPGQEELCGYPLLDLDSEAGFDEARSPRGIDDNCDGLLFGQEPGEFGSFEVDADRDGHYRDCEAHIILEPGATPTPDAERLAVDCVDSRSDINPSVENATCTNVPHQQGVGNYDTGCFRENIDSEYTDDSVRWFLDQDGDGDGDNPNGGDPYAADFAGGYEDVCQGENPGPEYLDGALSPSVTDCADDNPARNGFDLDGDGQSSCDGDFLNGQTYDNDPTVSSGGTEVCDGKDNDLNGFADDPFDNDLDGSYTSTLGGGPETCGSTYAEVDCDDDDPILNANDVDNDGTSTCGGDCDDGNPSISATDADGDGFTTCDAIPDCNDADPSLNNSDVDTDGFTSCQGDCDDNESAVNPAAQSQCDGFSDTNCDGVFDPLEVDDDGDGTTECEGDCNDANAALSGVDADGDGFTTCSGDCDDNEAAAYPGAPAVCDSVLDNDCNGVVDVNEADLDGDGFTGCTTTVDCNDNDPALNGTDADGDGVSTCQGDCDDSDATASPAIDADGDGWSTCAAGNQPADCDDSNAGLNYSDADGDGDSTCGTDCDDLDPTATGLDADGDGATSCDANPDCDDTNSALDPGNSEPPTGTPDGFDNDCDGMVDEGQLDVGDIAIVEMLIGAASPFTDGEAEFVEIISTRTDVDIDLRGMVVQVVNVVPDPSSPGSTTTSTQTYTIPASSDPDDGMPVPLVSGSITNATRVVLARSGAISGSNPVYSLSGTGYVWGPPLVFSDLGGTITVSHGGVVLDSVTWFASGCVSNCEVTSTNPVYDLDQDAGAARDRSRWRPGFSMGVGTISTSSASTNDEPNNWCEEQVAQNTNLYGTPSEPPNTALRVCN